MATLLVTGATGFIGKHLVPYMQAKGHHVRCAVWQPTPLLSAEQFIVNRLGSSIDWREALHEVDYVIHLAARVHIMDKVDDDQFIQINSQATKELAEQAAAAGVKRFIFLSSIKVNGEYTLPNQPFTENNLSEPQDLYAQSKWLAEQYLMEISQQSAMQTIVLRPPLVYGPGVKANFLQLIKIVAKGWPLPFGRVKNKRSFVFIDNLLHAIDTVTTAPLQQHTCFLVTDDEAWSLAELIKEMGKHLGKKDKLLPIPVSLLKVMLSLLGKKDTAARLFNSLEVSNQQLTQMTGWRPQITASEGLRQTIKWYLGLD